MRPLCSKEEDSTSSEQERLRKEQKRKNGIYATTLRENEENRSQGTMSR